VGPAAPPNAICELLRLDLPAMQAHNAGMKSKTCQYTVRDVPERLDRRLREVASEYGTSLNTAVVVALSKGVGIEPETAVHHDLDDLAGTWVRDEAFDKAMEEMDRVDEDLWR
jgi:hypothetical protein